MDSSIKTPTYERKWRKIYHHTKYRYKNLQRENSLLHPDRKINGINRNIIFRYTETKARERAEGRGSYGGFSSTNLS